ncbi:hypothetical protein RN001_003640 [Aquatica leii]|uniref:Uncharacterized protein n=1 Tax=Aquatica leii TaxID=1421715 RepID=A0AAN7SME9_9COLE|nr:hypothetical protein RN001_003640 [Aquatica leii]
MSLYGGSGKARFEVTTEEQQNLFQTRKYYAIAHCVSEDIDMSRGVAVVFKKKEERKRTSEKKKASSYKRYIYKKKNKILHKNVSYNEDDEDELSLHDDSDNDVETHVWIPEVEPSGFEELDNDPDPNDFVLVQFNAKKEIVFCVGKVVQTENLKNEIEVNFLRNSKKFTGHFVFPNVPDISMVSTEDIKMILPPPTLLGSTKRLQSYYKFEINFGSLNMR